MNQRKRILPLLSLGLQMLADRRLHYDSKMTSCHVCYSSRAGGRMFNVLIYELGTILEKKKKTRELIFSSSLYCSRLQCSKVFHVYGLVLWKDWASCFHLSDRHSLWSLFLGEPSRPVQKHMYALVNGESPWPT